MSREQENKALVGRWFEGFWGNPWNPQIIDELAAPDMLLQYSLHVPRRGRQDVRNFMLDFRAAFPDLKFWGAADLIAEGDYVVGRWEGGGTHTGPAFSDFIAGSLPPASGRAVVPRDERATDLHPRPGGGGGATGTATPRRSPPLRCTGTRWRWTGTRDRRLDRVPARAGQARDLRRRAFLRRLPRRA